MYLNQPRRVSTAADVLRRLFLGVEAEPCACRLGERMKPSRRLGTFQFLSRTRYRIIPNGGTWVRGIPHLSLLLYSFIFASNANHVVKFLINPNDGNLRSLRGVTLTLRPTLTLTVRDLCTVTLCVDPLWQSL